MLVLTRNMVRLRKSSGGAWATGLPLIKESRKKVELRFDGGSVSDPMTIRDGGWRDVNF
jgi:hypothetical protein